MLDSKDEFLSDFTTDSASSLFPIIEEATKTSSLWKYFKISKSNYETIDSTTYDELILSTCISSAAMSEEYHKITTSQEETLPVHKAVLEQQLAKIQEDEENNLFIDSSSSNVEFNNVGGPLRTKRKISPEESRANAEKKSQNCGR